MKDDDILKLDIKKLRHDVSSAVGLIDTAYEELREDSTNEMANHYFRIAMTQLRELIYQLDQVSAK